METFKINYKSDFVLRLASDAGWGTAFTLEFWSNGAPTKRYYATHDGNGNYTNCKPDSDTELRVMFDDHGLGIGNLMLRITYSLADEEFRTGKDDEVVNVAAITVLNDEGEEVNVVLNLEGETAAAVQYSLPLLEAERKRQNAEAQRNINETQRIAAELQRQLAETLRKQAELDRQASEDVRKSNESTREAAEQQRQTAEAARAAEFKTNEAARKETFETNEAERQATFEANEAERQVLYEKVAKNTDGIELLNTNTGVSEYPTFDEAKAYAVGDVVLYEGLLKRFTSAHEAGAWDASQVEDWSERKEVDGKVSELGSKVSILSSNIGNHILEYNIIEGEYISSIGKKIEADYYARTSDIVVKAHNTLTAFATGYNGNVSVISKVDGSIYTSLLRDNGSTDGVLTAYTYRNESDADIIVTCSFLKQKGISIFISENASVDYANEINKRSINNTQCISSIYDSNKSIYTVIPNIENGYYINERGTKTPNNDFTISDPISVKDGDVITVMAQGYLSKVSIISKYINGNYEPLIISDDSDYREYIYTVEVDCEIVICTNASYKIEVNIETKSLASTVEDVRYINKEVRENGSVKGLYISHDGILISASAAYIIYFYIAKNDGVLNFSYQLGTAPGTDVGGLGRVDSIEDIVVEGVLSDFLVKPSKSLSYDVSVSVKKGDILILSTNAAIRNTLKVVAKTQVIDVVGQTKIPLTDFSMFENFAVIGDSYASGQIYNADNTSLGTFYNLSWGQVLARKHGNVCINMSKGGMTTVSWLADNSKGLGLLQNSEAQQLYICALGINDSSSVELGRASDIGTSAETFYGAYSRIIDAIIFKAPDAKIIIATLANASKYDYNNAIIDIANHYGIPCIREDEDEFFLSSFYKDNMVGGHPTAPVYAGMATAFDRMIQQCIVDNAGYFKVI